MQIAGIDFGDRPIFLAPMEDVSDPPFRLMCKRFGADMLYTEFISSGGLMYGADGSHQKLDIYEEERPVAIQIFGGDVDQVREATKIVDDVGPDIIDINFGCPVKKVVSKNGGSSLLRDCPVLAQVAESIAKGVGEQVPVTAKIRIGWDQNLINAPEVCRILEESGMQAISIHGRTRAQGYSGEADWDVIDQCTREVSIPVIGNGDISSGADVELRKQTTGVSGVMIGRAAMQYPWVFRDAKHYLATGEHPSPVSLEERWELIIRHARMLIEWGKFSAEKYAIQSLRSRLMAYSKGLPAGKLLRTRFSTISSLAEIEDLAAEHLRSTQAASECLPLTSSPS